MPYQYPPAFRQDFIVLMLRGESASHSGVWDCLANVAPMESPGTC